MMKKIWFPLLLLCISVPTEAREIKVLYGELPPFMFIKDKNPAGFYYDLLQEMKKEMGEIEFSYEYLPVKRMITTTQKEPGTMCLGLTRNPKRENLFKWVGPSMPRRVGVYRLNSRTDLRLETADDFMKYRFGVGRGYAAIQDLLKHGVPMEHIEEVSRDSGNVNKLFKNRIDFYASIDVVAVHNVKLEGFSWSDIHCERIINDNYMLYYVFNIETEDSIISEFQKALDKVKESGKWEKLVDFYTGKSYANGENASSLPVGVQP